MGRGVGVRRPTRAQDRPPSHLPSGPWADAGGSSRVPPGPGRRGGRSRGQRPQMARGADARGWGRRLGARPPHPHRCQRQAPGSAEAPSMDPQPPAPAGVTAREGASRRGRAARGPLPGAPSPSPGSWEEGTSPRPGDREAGDRGAPGGRARAAGGGEGRAAAPSAVRGPGVGGPEGCWRLRLALSPSLGLSLSLWSHPEVPQRRCLTRCPPAARPRAGRGGAGRGRPGPSPLPSLPPPRSRGLRTLSGAAFCMGASVRLVRPGPHPSDLPLSAAPPLPRPRSGLLRLLSLPAAPGPCLSVCLSPLFHPSPSLRISLLHSFPLDRQVSLLPVFLFVSLSLAVSLLFSLPCLPPGHTSMPLSRPRRLPEAL